MIQLNIKQTEKEQNKQRTKLKKRSKTKVNIKSPCVIMPERNIFN